MTSARRTPLFRTLVAGWTVANFADSLLTVILAVWVVDLTGSVALGGLMFAALGAPALLSPLLGDLADRVSRRKLLAVAYLTGAAALVPLLWVDTAEFAWAVFASTFVYATVAYVSGACQAGLLRDTLPDADLGHANGLLSMIDQVLKVALPFAGAAVYAWVGIQPLLVAAASAFVIAALIFAFVRIREAPRQSDGRGYFVTMFAGFAHLFTALPLRSLAWRMVLVMFALGMLNGVAFAILERLDVPASWLGPLMVGQGIGGILAGLLAPRLMNSFGRVRVYAVGVVAVGISLIPLASDWLPLMIASQLAVGFAVTAAVITFLTERQIATPAGLQGRVAAASQVVLNLPGVIATVAASAALVFIDYRVMIVAGAVLLVATGASALRLRSVPAGVRVA